MNLLELTENNSSFSREIPGYQVVWDSTSLGALKDCPWKYYLSIIEGWTLRKGAVALTFGIAYHAALETYERSIISGASTETATIAAVRKALEWSPTLSGSEDNRRTIFTLVRAVVWWIEEYRHDSMQTVPLANGKAAVELTFKFEIFDGIFLAGHLDRVVSFDHKHWVSDHKTTTSGLDGRYFTRYSPDNQMSMYSLASQMVFGMPVAGVIIDACELAVGFNRYARGIASRTKGQLNEWLDDTMYWIDTARRYAEDQHWPANDKACFMCAFRDVCSKDPAVREAFLNADFIRRTWDPSKPR